MNKLSESNLKDEVKAISEFLENLYEDDKEFNEKVVISPRTYCRHLASMYLIIECIRNEVFTESKATGEYKVWLRVDAFLKGLGL